MRVHRRILAVLSTGIVLANAPLARVQDATSANLPEQFETREAMLTPKPKKKKKKTERGLKIAARTLSRKPAPATEQTKPAAELRTGAARVEKKSRVKKRATSAVQP